jgi:uncharacterized oligopeptide transporter (OPT) family protein
MTHPRSARPSFKSILAGAILSIMLCLMNSYLTLSFGVIEEGPSIAALFFFAFCTLFRLGVASDEMVMVATMGSAGGSLGFITNFYAAKAMTGTAFTVVEMASFGIVTSLLGLLFVIPLREMLVVKADLPWPGSKAVAAVIKSLVAEGDRKQGVYLLVTTVLMLVAVVVNDDGGFGWYPSEIPFPLFGLAAFGAGLALSPFATAGSYLMGMDVCWGFLVGGVVLLVEAPFLPPEFTAAPHRYVWPGIGFLLASGLMQMVLNGRVMLDAIKSVTSLSAPGDGDDNIMGKRGFAILAVVSLSVTCAFSYVMLDLNIVVIVALVVVAGFIQNVIATRAAAQTAFNPARVMGVLLEGITSALGAKTAGQNLMGAGFVAGSGAQAGTLTGDLAFGRWLKVPARWQFWGQAMTVIPCAFVSALVFSYIQQTTPVQLEGGSLAAPVAKIWAVSALVFEGQRQMPANAVPHGLIAGLVAVIYVLLENKTPLKRFLPSSTGVGIGLVLSPSTDFAFFVGGFFMWVVAGRWFKVSEATLTTVAVSCIVGEGIGGVLKPLLATLGFIKVG